MLRTLLMLAGFAGASAPLGALAPLPEDAPMPRRVPAEDPKPAEPKPSDPKPKTPRGPKGDPAPKTGDAETPTAPGAKAAAKEEGGKLPKYDSVIPADAKTTAGLFAVHRVKNKAGGDDKVYFEIPADKLGKLIMMRAEVSRGPAGGSFNGQELGKKFVKLERRDNKILVIEAEFDKRSGKDTADAVESTGVEPIIGTLAVAAEGKDRSMVVQVDALFLTDPLDLGARRAGGGAGSINQQDSFLTDVKSFPTNIEVRAQLTFRGGGLGAPGLPPGLGGGASAKTAVVHYSVLAMPETPMAPRLFDPRVGFFTEGFRDFSAKRTWSEDKEYITRFRLEKKDPSKEVSEPVKPITFYVAKEVPEKYREAMKKGIEDWKPAFEKAGFKNAIVAKDPPTKAENPDFDPEDARFSVIRWVAEPIENAFGPHVADPRSGETISAHVVMYHDILKILHMWYFVQCSAVDERARSFPFPDDLQQELVRYVVAHEVGHTLGLRHNHRASQAYTVEQLRDPKFVEKNGNLASIMSYGRYNYVAQPEDKIAAKDLIPKLGPYDLFAIEYGYKPLPDAKTPEAEKAALDEIASRQLKESNLRFGGEDGPSTVDPTVITENIGSDAVKATELGYKNLERVFGYLVKSTTAKGEDFETLRTAYGALNQHRRLWMGSVIKQVGGVVESRTLGDGGEQFSRIPKEKQKEAVEFILKHGFHAPKSALDPQVINTLKFAAVAGDVISFQTGTLRGLLSAQRLNRLLDMEVLQGDKAYTIAELVSDVQGGVFEELKADAPKVDPLRRNLQRAYFDILKTEFDPQPQGGGLTLNIPRRGPISIDEAPARSLELRAVARMQLRELKKQLDAAIPKAKDTATKLHLSDLSEEIDAVFAARRK